MNIGIFGQHPENKVGFNSAMSMNWIMSLTSKGHHVTLYIRKDSIRTDPARLSKWGLNFRIIEISKGDYFSENEDVLIWQTYHAEDHRDFWEIFKSSSAIKTKNFPRFFSGDYSKDINRLKKSLSAFDLVLFALEEDFKIAKLIMQDEYKFAYVPRGFSAKYLTPKFDSDSFLISIDVRKRHSRDSKDYQVFFDAKKILGAKGEKIKFQTLGANIFGCKKVKKCNTIDFYKEFINPCHVYAFVDRNSDYQDHHNLSGGLTTYCGVYENSIVEANISGSMVVGPDKFMASELVTNGYSGVRLKDDQCERSMAEAFLYCLENQSFLSKGIRKKTLGSNSLNSMSNKFEIAINKII